MTDKLKILSSDQAGFNGLWCYGEWKIAFMNDAPHLRIENIKTISRHLCTDEAFVLLEGNANMYIGDGETEVGNIEKIPYEKNKLYVVTKGTWHQIETFEGTKLLIVEQADTSPENSETVDLSCDLPN